MRNSALPAYFWFSSSDRARRELGYDPRPVRHSLADAYAWWNARDPFQYRGFNRFMLRPRGA